MAITFTQWIDQTKNRYWDMDGAYGAQCWDLWAKYCMDMYGLSVSDCITPTGYAGGLYTAYPTSSRVEQTFERKAADGYTPVAGDVAIWGYSSSYPYTHVAIVIQEDVSSDNKIRVLTQNPDASADKWLTLDGILGYLHPRTLPESPDRNPTGDDNKGSADTSRGGAWIHWQGDNLYLHETDNHGSKTRVFYRTTANNFQEKASQSQPSDDEGQSHPSSAVSPENSYALYVVGSVEAGLRWDAVESNLQGIGIAQWSFERRLQVLNAMKAADPTGYAAFKTAAPEVAALMDSGGTFKRSLTSTEAAAFRTWAGRSESREGQRTQFAEDYAGYPQEYSDTKMQILWVTAYHQSPANALKVPKASNLSGLKANILSTYPFQPYGNRYNQAYSLLSVWDGKANPPAF